MTDQVSFLDDNPPTPSPTIPLQVRITLEGDMNDLLAFLHKLRQDRKGPRRGRHPGQLNLTADQVREVRRRLAAGETKEVIAQDFAVHPRTVELIETRQTWANLPD